MAGLASQLLTKLLRRSKWFIGWLILDILRLIVIYITAAVTGIALQTSIQTHNFIQNWTSEWSEVAQPCPTLCDPMSLGFSVHRIFQARVLEWVAISFSRGSSWLRDRTQVSCFAGRRFTLWATREENWTKDAHTMWATQARIDEDIQNEIRELKTAIKWVGDQLIDVQKQVILRCDWNSIQFWVESESEVAQSCPTLCDPMDCSPPGSSVHGIFQARILEWAAISFSRGSSQPRDWTQVSRITGRCFNLVLLLFNSILVPITGSKSNFIYKIYMIMPLWMYNYCKKKSLKPSLRVCPHPPIWKF